MTGETFPNWTGIKPFPLPTHRTDASIGRVPADTVITQPMINRIIEAWEANGCQTLTDGQMLELTRQSEPT